MRSHAVFAFAARGGQYADVRSRARRWPPIEEAPALSAPQAIARMWLFYRVVCVSH